MIPTFKETGFLVVRNYLDQIGLDNRLLQEYFRLKFSSVSSEPDSLTPGSANYYADVLTETILKLSTPNISQYTGYNLLPSYSFTRLYLKGNILNKHLDRKEAQISGTLCVDISDEKYPSEIYMSPTKEESDAVKIILNPGDLCLYDGSKMWHWRNRIKNDWLLQVFLHYVDGDSDKKEFIYDKRSYLAQPPNNKNIRKTNILSKYFDSYISNAYQSDA